MRNGNGAQLPKEAERMTNALSLLTLPLTQWQGIPAHNAPSGHAPLRCHALQFPYLRAFKNRSRTRARQALKCTIYKWELLHCTAKNTALKMLRFQILFNAFGIFCELLIGHFSA